MGITDNTPFWVLYVILTFLMMYSGLVFQSKTIRTMIFVPISMGIAERFGYPVISLALPVSMLIEHVYVLPFNSKPAALLYNTNQYSMTDALQVRHHDDDHLLADNPPLGRDRPQMARHHPGFVLCGIICYIRKCMPGLF